jgi:hypothetical protein
LLFEKTLKLQPYVERRRRPAGEPIGNQLPRDSEHPGKLRAPGRTGGCTTKAVFGASELRPTRSYGLIIYTQFQWFSADPDVPMFWEVSWYSFSPYTSGERRFGTKDEALAWHEGLVSGEQAFEELTDDDEAYGADAIKFHNDSTDGMNIIAAPVAVRGVRHVSIPRLRSDWIPSIAQRRQAESAKAGWRT